VIKTCDFLTIAQIKRQHLEIERIEDLKNKSCCGNCKEFTEDSAFFVFGKCSLDGLDKGKNTVCEKWIKNGV
jgi:hypothetical protein